MVVCNALDAGLKAKEALDLALKGGAVNLGRDDIGRIAPGMAADIVAWRTDTIQFAGCQHDLVAGLVFSPPSQPVDLSVINGDVVVKGGQLLTADLKVNPQEDAHGRHPAPWIMSWSVLVSGQNRLLLLGAVRPGCGCGFVCAGAGY